MSGLIFAVTAQMSLHGILAPWRDRLAGLWITGSENVNLLSLLHLPNWFGLAIGIAVAVLALILSLRNRIGAKILIFASGVGFAVAVGWGLTWNLVQVSFEPIPVTSVTFSGPSANTLMFFLDRNAVLEFDVGLVPGVVLGALVSSLLSLV